jgi:hypothetical protein
MLLATQLANRDFLQKVQKYAQSRRLCDPLGPAKWLKIRHFPPGGVDLRDETDWWWRSQSAANPSLPGDSLICRESSGNFRQKRGYGPVSAATTRGNHCAFPEIPYARDQGSFSAEQGSEIVEQRTTELRCIPAFEVARWRVSMALPGGFCVAGGRSGRLPGWSLSMSRSHRRYPRPLDQARRAIKITGPRSELFLRRIGVR